MFQDTNTSKDTLHPTSLEYSPLSSSEEEEQPLQNSVTARKSRSKPNKKHQKYKAQLIGSLVASLVVFLMVLVTIVSLATSHSTNSSTPTIVSTVNFTTIINSVMTENNYEDLADPKDIIIEGFSPVTTIDSYDTADVQQNETVDFKNNLHAAINIADPEQVLIKEMNTSSSQDIVSVNSNNTNNDEDGNDEDYDDDELQNVINPGDYFSKLLPNLTL